MAAASGRLRPRRGLRWLSPSARAGALIALVAPALRSDVPGGSGLGPGGFALAGGGAPRSRVVRLTRPLGLRGLPGERGQGDDVSDALLDLMGASSSIPFALSILAVGVLILAAATGGAIAAAGVLSLIVAVSFLGSSSSVEEIQIVGSASKDDAEKAAALRALLHPTIRVDQDADELHAERHEPLGRSGRAWRGFSWSRMRRRLSGSMGYVLRRRKLADSRSDAPAGGVSWSPADKGQEISIEVPLDKVPGMAEANIVVSEATAQMVGAPSSGDTGADLLMAQDCGKIIVAMAQHDWVIEADDESQGRFNMYLPSVEYSFPLGSVSIPAPHFVVTVRDSARWSPHQVAATEAVKSKEQLPKPPEERMVGSMVLQNGKDIFSVELGFPVNTTLRISAAGLAYARVGRSPNGVYLSCDVDLGMKLPGLPGLTKIMRLFVKSYAAKSAQDCANALAGGADRLALRAKAADAES